jgi:hypothetical protein
MSKSKMDQHILHFAKDPPESTSLVENQKILNSKDFRLKEAMIKADPEIGPQMIWSFDDQPLAPNDSSTIITNSHYNTHSGSATSVGPGSFWIPNRVYYSNHDWPAQGVITAGIRVIRFITLFSFGDYCSLQQQSSFKALYNGNIDPIIDPIKQFAITIPDDGKIWLKQNNLAIGSGGDAMIAGHYGPCNWVGTNTPIGSQHHFRFIRYLAPLITNQNFLNTDVLNILILFNNGAMTPMDISAGSAVDQPIGAGIISFGFESNQVYTNIFDYPRYLPWVGNRNETLVPSISPGPGSGIYWNETNYGMGFSGISGEFIAGISLTYNEWLKFSVGLFGDPTSGFNVDFFGVNGSQSYGIGSKRWNTDIQRLQQAYPKFYNHKTIIFHSAPPPYGFVSGIDSPGQFYLITSIGPSIIQPVVTLDQQIQWAVQTVTPLIQNMCTELAPYGVSYGGTVNENTTFDYFIPYIQDYLNS